MKLIRPPLTITDRILIDLCNSNVFELKDEGFDISKIVMSLPGNKVLKASDVINNYRELTPNYYHTLDELTKMNTLQDDTNIYNMNNNKVLKYVATNDINIMEAFYREIIIGLEINKLKSPNFIKTIGFATDEKCIVPVKDEYVSECIYLYLEKVDGPTFYHYILNADSFSEFKRIINELIESYLKAWEELNFTHYDLHPCNIIIRKVNGIPRIPVIIDFGASHISLENGDLGENEIMFSRYPDRSLWVKDFFGLFGQLWRLTSREFIENRKHEFIKLLYDEFKYKQNYNESYYDYVDRIKNKCQDTEEWKNLEKSIDEISRLDEHSSKKSVIEINNYIIFILKYFDSSIDARWLVKYENVDKYWGSYPTKEGEKASFSNFVNYVKKY